MREKMKKSLYILITAAVMLGGLRVSMTVRAQEIEQQAEVSRAAEETGVSVTTREDFMKALEQNARLTVKKLLSVRDTFYGYQRF